MKIQTDPYILGGFHFQLRWRVHGVNDWELLQDIDATADEVRNAFSLAADDYPGDCLDVTQGQAEWLESKTGKAPAFGTFSYQLEIVAA